MPYHVFLVHLNNGWHLMEGFSLHKAVTRVGEVKPALLVSVSSWCCGFLISLLLSCLPLGVVCARVPQWLPYWPLNYTSLCLFFWLVALVIETQSRTKSPAHLEKLHKGGRERKQCYHWINLKPEWYLHHRQSIKKPHRQKPHLSQQPGQYHQDLHAHEVRKNLSSSETCQRPKRALHPPGDRWPLCLLIAPPHLSPDWEPRTPLLYNIQVNTIFMQYYRGME